MRAKIIRIYHEVEGGIEISVPKITVWYHKACQVITNSDPEGWLFLSHPYTNNQFFVLLTNEFLFFRKLPDFREYAKMQYNMMTSH